MARKAELGSTNPQRWQRTELPAVKEETCYLLKHFMAQPILSPAQTCSVGGVLKQREDLVLMFSTGTKITVCL